MEIIIELIYGLHMMMLLISYECMTILLQINPSFKKMLKECFILSSSFILLFFDEGNSFVFMVWFLLFFILYRKRVFLYFPTFMIVYCTVVFFISSLSYYSYVYNGICIVQIGFSFILSTVVMVLCLLTTTMYIVYCRKKIKQIDFMYDVKLLMGQRVVCLNMLLDSGNDLYYAGFPMIVLSRHRVTGYVVIDQIESQGVVSKIMDVIIVDTIEVNGQVLEHVYAGVIDDLGYDGLLNKNLMGGVL